MAGTYSYTTVVGGNCCYFGQVDKVIPQPGQGLLILGLCDCFKVVTAKLKAGETAVCGQVLFFDVATGELTTDDSDLTCVYGVSKEDVDATAGAAPVVVYVKGGFDADQLVFATESATAPAVIKAMRGVDLYTEKRH